MKIFASGIGEHAAQDGFDGVELGLSANQRGATWTTGSPRSSVRQYSPASKSAADTWPSSRARSSSVKVCLVAWSLTSSMPKKYPSPRMSPTMGRSYSFSRVARSAGNSA